MSGKLLRLITAILALAAAGPLAAQVLPDGPVLAAADLRPEQSLDGEWTWSIDPYRDGAAGFHGGEPGQASRRFADVDVTQASADDPLALYEYDLDHSPVSVLPSSWLTHSAEMRHYQGLVWYQKRFDTAAKDGERQFIRFGAANYAAEVWLNGKRLGRHEGGFTSFAFEVTGLLRPQGNRLVVGVDSQRDGQSIPPPVTDWETYGGITRPVELIVVPATYVDDAWVRLKDRATIAVDVSLNGPGASGAQVRFRIPELRIERTMTTDASGRASLSLPRPPSALWWSPDGPKLYDVEIVAGGDTWRDRVGFRTIATDGPRILLNGKPIFLKGISVHEEELGANPTRNMTPQAARALLGLAKDGLHANYVRLAHYPHSETMLRAADEMGLIVWSEIPVYWRIAFDDPVALEKARRMLAEMILRDRNRAAIALWSVGNETPQSPARNAFMKQLAADVRVLDPTRLVTAALLVGRDDSGPVPVQTMDDPLAASLDVMAVNAYNGWYTGDRLADLSKIEWRVPQDKPLLFSEVGAGAKAGLHQPDNPGKFSEEFQAEYYRQTLAMLARIPNFEGISPWILKDFRSPRRQRPGIQDGWNRKGLVSETGQRKEAFDVLAEWYAKKE
ncbi:beta-glucuronidase [Altererythrobacter salegens]|uniref:Beta-glucuronidase n=1 Tax=Croceibacterium salegens TaxID=1737568 RepID=A0A6I4SRE7_9SPHN|nr:glycoside hydrolase family 2 TIM barrel-domain containing protein [Croceibacterium salegens]MXO57988.1 beta-glucuronidase [Croceibacterium salegens]